jgi:3'-phosphoadenosine 5'-phosphosulfate sulfotransferase (PAPS reductase)/FAD synthetase
VNVWDLPIEDKERLKGQKVILSMSGGKDSTAAALLLERHGIDFTSVFMDTGWEHPATYEYVDQVLLPRFGNIVKVSANFPDPDDEGQFVALIRKKGIFPSRLTRFCTTELKMKPFKKFLDAQDDECVTVVGIRRQESKARSAYERWKFNDLYDGYMFSPLVDHTFEDVIQMHQEGGIQPNPLYLQGAERVGCFPCIFARKSEVKMGAKVYPKRYQDIERLEEQTGMTFFHNRGGQSKIKDVVAWAQTERGGKQFSMFDFTAQDGCTRWGLCEAPESNRDFVQVEEPEK